MQTLLIALVSFQTTISFVGHFVTLPMTIDGRGPYTFALDTGASGAVLSKPVEDALQLPVVDHVQVVGLGSATVKQPMVMLSLAAGAQRFDPVKAAVSDLPVNGDESIDGIVGLDLFKGMLLTIDYPSGTITAERGRLMSGYPGVTALSMRHGIPSVSGTVDGRSVAFDIDTGSNGGVALATKFEQQLDFLSEPKPIGQARGVGGTMTVDAGTINGDLVFDGFRVHDPQIAFLPLSGDGNLGYGILKGYAITFDVQDRLVRFASPAGS